MRTRTALLDLFSTFLVFADDCFAGWTPDPRLVRSMKRSLSHQSTAENEHQWSPELFWSLYWCRCWQHQPNPLATGHLSAYLQEPCYWVARTIATQSSTLAQLADYFQIAIANVPKIVNGYDSTQPATLKTYASLCFRNTIRDTLRQQGEADQRSDWGLLRKVSQKRLREALVAAGLSATTVNVYVLAWTGFKALWTSGESPGTRQLAAPDASTWAAIAQFYNGQSQSLDLPPASPADLEKGLILAAKHLRTYLHPTSTSLNAQKGDDEKGEYQDDLASPDLPPLELLVQSEELRERTEQRSQLSDVLSGAIAALDSTAQELLSVYYGQSLTQQQIAARLDMKQYTVSRRLSSIRESLLLALARWSESQLHKPPTSAVLNTMGVALEEWLQAHYQPGDRSNGGEA